MVTRPSFFHFRKWISRNQDWRDKFVLYSSQEDVGYFYKSFIEDIIYGLELAGAKLIPSFKYLKAHSNKVFMEILRDQVPIAEIKNLKANYYGSYEEALKDETKFNYPVVIKSAEGAMSKNVALARNKLELKKTIKKLSATRKFKEEIREFIRDIKYNGYQMQSKYRKKFVIQNFIPGLSNDWKVLVFGDKNYIFERHVRKNDFRASGSGQSQYLYGSKSKIPDGIFRLAKKIKDKLNVPMISLDFAVRGEQLYLLEFQVLYYGTVGQWRSDCYFQFDGQDFVKKENNLSLEDVYVESVIKFLN
ncbi:MAG: hypothetical protein U5L09_08770 [Bacteroidales bacterium]|nr:hypothetical protein [Bacteroidales bacterium]